MDDELIAALSAELEAESGLPVLPMSAAGGTGIEAVLDALMERLVLAERGELPDTGDDLAEERPWSPL